MRTLITLSLLLASIYGYGATSADTIAVAAEHAYRAGDHAAALERYMSLMEQGVSSDLYYNIGNCHYKLGDVANATLFYERALKLAPGDEDIRANLELARSRNKDRVNELPGSTMLVQWDRLVGGRDPDHWARRSMASVALLFALLIATLFMSPSVLRRWTRVMAALVAVYAVLAFGMAVSRHATLTDSSNGIVMVPKVEVRSEPNSASTTLFVIHKGTKVRVLQNKDQWVEIKLSNGTVGWMLEEGMTRI
jgi:hypothetical protein